MPYSEGKGWFQRRCAAWGAGGGLRVLGEFNDRTGTRVRRGKAISPELKI